MTHYVGDPVPLAATFVDVTTGLPADPASVTFQVRRELDAETPVTGTSTVVGTWVGIYMTTGPGLHQVRVDPPGNGKVQQDSFWVEANNVT